MSRIGVKTGRRGVGIGVTHGIRNEMRFFFSLPLALDVKRMGAPHLFDQLVFLIWAHPSEPVSKRVGDPYLFDLVWFSNYLRVRRTAMGSYVVWPLCWPRLSRSTLGPPGKISFRVVSTRAISLVALF